MQLEINRQELETLEELLRRSLGDVREEVYKAEVSDYKAGLKAREAVVTALLERVQAARALA
jgi:hypothetical protein